MDVRQLHKRLFDAARALIPSGHRVVCGVSGGADSTALLVGLHAVNQRRRCGWTLHVAHLDHGLRAEAASDAEFVAETAASMRLDCTIERADVAVAAKRAREGVEETGRRLRYEFLERTAEHVGAGFVAVGHNADDQVETVLYNIVRGTGLRGLAGMAARRPIREASPVQLVRPLLSFQRDELRAFLQHRGVPYRHDQTNDDADAATRNRIRLEVLPLLEDRVNPEVAAAVLRLASQAAETVEFLAAAAEHALKRITIARERNAIALAADEFAALPWAIQKEVVVAVLRRLNVNLGPLSSERIEAAAQAVIPGVGRRRRIQLPGKVVVERRRRELSFSKQQSVR